MWLRFDADDFDEYARIGARSAFCRLLIAIKRAGDEKTYCDDDDGHERLNDIWSCFATHRFSPHYRYLLWLYLLYLSHLHLLYLSLSHLHRRGL